VELPGGPKNYKHDVVGGRPWRSVSQLQVGVQIEDIEGFQIKTECGAIFQQSSLLISRGLMSN
jgi:hypothetical protein